VISIYSIIVPSILLYNNNSC